MLGRSGKEAKPVYHHLCIFLLFWNGLPIEFWPQFIEKLFFCQAFVERNIIYYCIHISYSSCTMKWKKTCPVVIWEYIGKIIFCMEIECHIMDFTNIFTFYNLLLLLHDVEVELDLMSWSFIFVITCDGHHLCYLVPVST